MDHMHLERRIGYRMEGRESRNEQQAQELAGVNGRYRGHRGGRLRSIDRDAGKAAAPQTRAVSPTVSVPAVEILSWDQTQRRREQLRGKVVVLDVWSTYCDPCIREFPNLVKLQTRFAKQVACISFNTDYAEQKTSRRRHFANGFRIF